jgi:uncharacterized membrane protein HdeD (DUF308 family)
MNGDVKSNLFSLALLGIVMCAGGMLYIVTSLNPQRNSVTRHLFRITTFLPRVGSMTDEKWVLVNGVVFLLAGLFAILRALFGALLHWPISVR